MNILFYITLGFLPYLLQSAAENDITATGGGVVEIGKELVLKYNINTAKLAENWSCKWLRYVPTGNDDQTKTEWCIFSLENEHHKIYNILLFLQGRHSSFLGSTLNWISFGRQFRQIPANS